MKRKYPVCGKTYFEGWYDICKECGWEYDNVQEGEPDFDAGPNDISLNEYRKKYLAGRRPGWLDSLDDDENEIETVYEKNRGEQNAN